MGSEGVGQLRKKGFRKPGQAPEAQLDTAAFRRHVHLSEKIVPQTQRKTGVNPVGTFRQILGVVPLVHLGAIENIFQRPQRQINIGVVEVSDGEGKQVHQKELIDSEPDHGQGYILDGAVHHGFHPMVAEVAGEAHFLDAVVHFMKFPQPGRVVQQAVHIPLDKIPDHKQQQQLPPYGQMTYLDSHQIGHPEQGQKIVEGYHGYIGNGVVGYQRKQKEIEEHIESIEPEVMPDRSLIFAPGKQDFQTPHYQRNRQQPVEVIGPAGL